MDTLAALIKAREVAEVELKGIKTPARADVAQLQEAYPIEHTITVLTNLIKALS